MRNRVRDHTRNAPLHAPGQQGQPAGSAVTVADDDIWQAEPGAKGGLDARADALVEAGVYLWAPPQAAQHQGGDAGNNRLAAGDGES